VLQNGQSVQFVATVSISLNPLLYRLVDPAERWVARRRRRGRWLTPRRRGRPPPPPPAETDPRFRAVVGYGPVGRTLYRLLRENGIEPTVIEMNLETVPSLRSEGLPVVYGDAGRPEALAAAGVARTRVRVLSASGIEGPQEVVRMARELNPDVRVLTRSAYLRERAELRKAVADVVFSGEGEVALALVEWVLRELGDNPEQIH
jgi:CPA2 family monovalent cation:H+ antiporter-2